MLLDVGPHGVEDLVLLVHGVQVGDVTRVEDVVDVLQEGLILDLGEGGVDQGDRAEPLCWPLGSMLSLGLHNWLHFAYDAADARPGDLTSKTLGYGGGAQFIQGRRPQPPAQTGPRPSQVAGALLPSLAASCGGPGAGVGLGPNTSHQPGFSAVLFVLWLHSKETSSLGAPERAAPRRGTLAPQHLGHRSLRQEATSQQVGCHDTGALFSLGA